MTYKPELPTNIEGLHWVGPDDAAYREAGLIHCIYLPPEADSSRPAPVVVMVHGWGGDESVMWIFKRVVPGNVAIITPRAPLRLDDNSFIWFRAEGEKSYPERDAVDDAIDTLHHFLQGVTFLYPIAPAQLVLVGFSQGAMVCNAYTLRYPQQPLGVASLVGAMPPLREDELRMDKLSRLPVFIAHGSRDETIPVEAARLARQNYQELGATVTYGEYDTGHKMNSAAMADLEQWLTDLLNDKK